jgi:hypothetical protein
MARESQFGSSLKLVKQRNEVTPAVRRINVTEPYSVREWSDHFGCTPAQLRAAVSVVGNIAAGVEIQLRPVPVSPSERLKALNEASGGPQGSEG